MKDNTKKNIFSKMKMVETTWLMTPQQSASISGYVPNIKRLNDLDSNIVEQKANLKLDTEPLNLNYRIEDKEKTLKELTEKIKVADKVANQQELFGLRVKKQRVEQELRDLYKEYTIKDSSSAVTDSINGKVNGIKTGKMPVINAIKRFIKRYILAKISKKFNSLVILGDSLDTLTAINKNVDELLKIKPPYGESSENYQKLTEYLYRAHKIRSQINKSIKKA
jgi:hypothetical protein